MERLIHIVDEDESGERLDKFLSLLFDHYSRSQIKKLIVENRVFVNQTIEKASYIVKENDYLELHPFIDEPIKIEPYNFPLKIYYEDDDLLVIEKERGMVIHPAYGHYEETVVNVLLHHVKKLSTVNGMLRQGIVHRLDKETSGILVVAKNDEAHVNLQQQFKNRTVKRVYQAITYGTFKEDSGEINAPIGRDPKERKRMAVVENGREAITTYKVLEKQGNFSYVECQLFTGRTHQIRVHLTSIGHPIVGDSQYGPKKVIGKDGQVLHAVKLGFHHPRTEEWMEFSSPIPIYFEKVLKQLKFQ